MGLSARERKGAEGIQQDGQGGRDERGLENDGEGLRKGK